MCACRQPRILTDADGSVRVNGLRAESFDCAAHLLQALRTAAASRETSATARNDASSRSHAFYRLHLRRASSSEMGLLTFVDLAGVTRL